MISGAVVSVFSNEYAMYFITNEEWKHHATATYL